MNIDNIQSDETENTNDKTDTLKPSSEFTVSEASLVTKGKFDLYMETYQPNVKW